jgi:hypothetical protein
VWAARPSSSRTSRRRRPRGQAGSADHQQPPGFQGHPGLPEALPDEVATLEAKNLQVVHVTWEPPGGEPVNYILSLRDFEAPAKSGKMADLGSARG